MRFSHFIRNTTLALAGLATAFSFAAETHADPLAKDVFGAQSLPAATQAAAHGFYSKGCFAGGMAIAEDGPNWQAMRLSRNRRWGHPEMISLLERFSREAAQDGWPGLLIGDISQPRGGPMLSGHASHQLGLDADIWFVPMPTNGRLSARQRENMDFVSMLKPNSLHVDDRKWTPAHAAILRRAASYPNVERILVHPGIKKKLCDTVSGDRSWLRKVRPFWGHDSHFHIRIGCPAGSPGCGGQEATPRGEGCDQSLAWWFTDEPWRPATGPAQPRARDVMRLSALPAACKAVLSAPAPTSEAAVTVGGSGRTMLATTAAPPVAASAYAPTPERTIPVPQPRPYN
ncbi:penicillin-insensitive murein endopeptidase [Mesorhizobium microcysteis]|uniref:Penicillin-insensitive murein endopeptidase n=1 Tax=Neoaquamicrobium microcysteis TaxID=2682781 RepID=A0A5D4GW65_9HYPH|nr:penicillin-insensitive murein endopeptidase [Mesorhizobium microcysteis]TYR31525.1 penicillin-insensitive murein endopeptidase [Mesorhizobium microcysteis]